MIQGGDINSRDSIAANDGSGGPGYTIAHEIGVPHERGSLAAARQGDQMNPQKRSSGSQFYICHVQTSQLDGNYTVYGKLLEGFDEGFDVLDKIAATSTDARDRPVEDVYIMKAYMAKRADFR